MHSVHSLRTVLLAASLTLACASATPAIAQDLTVKAAQQATPVLIVGARVVTMNQSHDVYEHADVRIEGGRIASITPRDPASTPPLQTGVTVVEARGATLYPGFISPWSQLGLTEIQAVAASNDLAETGAITPEVRATMAVNPDSTLLPVSRKTGILLACVAPDGGTLPGQPGIIRLDGWTIDDLTIERSIGQTLRWPAMRTVSAWWMDRSEDQQREDIAKNLKAIAEAYDAASAYGLARTGDPTHAIDLRWEGMQATLPKVNTETHHPARTFVIANDAEQITAAVQFAQARGLRVVIVGGRQADRVAPLLIERDVPVILTGVQVFPGRADSAYDEPFTLPERLRSAGVRFTIAYSDDTAHERNLPFTVATAVAHGLPESAALRTLTIEAATILGIDDRYGSLEPGKSATCFLCVGGSPLEVTSDITRAWIDGRDIPLTSKHTELAKKYLERYQQSGDIPPAQQP